MKISTIGDTKKTAVWGFILAMAVALIFGGGHSWALSGSEFKAGRIIDDVVFYDGTTMSTTEIQNFLNAKLPTCDTNGAQSTSYYYTSATGEVNNDNNTWDGDQWVTTSRATYGKRVDDRRLALGKESIGSQAPYICLKDHRQDTGYKAGQSGLCSAIDAKTNRTAAQIIDDVAQACHISQKVILVMLQKEQGLVTDDWPWGIQYRGAMGYGCPDTAPCYAEYYGFFNQVYNAALQFQRYKATPNNWSHVPFMTNNVLYQANTPSCGSRSTYIENYATAGLYNYTPYTPNQAALANLYGTGDSCSAYGNRNFWRYYNDWFGSTLARYPYEWKYESQASYSDSARTNPFTSTPTVKPGETVYLRLKAKNIGYKNWEKTTMRLGTTRPMDTPSQYATPNWITGARATSLVEATVLPGQIGTFDFEMKMPTSIGTYKQYFNLLVEDREWLNDLGLYYNVNVNNNHPDSLYSRPVLDSEEVLRGDSYMLSQDGQSVLAVNETYGLNLYSNFRTVWSPDNSGKPGSWLIMQSDGNLVLYSATNAPLWATATNGNPGAKLVLQSDGNLVLYSATNAPLWASQTIHNPDHFFYVNNEWTTPGFLYPFQTINTINGNRRLVLQPDGNLVLYDNGNRPLWASGTNGKKPKNLVLQGDGNLVLYDTNNIAVWDSKTSRSTKTRLILQEDGNLVLYTLDYRPVWATYTNY